MNDPEQYHSWDFSLVTHALNVIQAQRMTTHNSAKWNRAGVGSTSQTLSAQKLHSGKISWKVSW